MKLLSVNVGLPREVISKGKVVTIISLKSLGRLTDPGRTRAPHRET